MAEDERPPYRLTARQGELWDHFEAVVQKEGALDMLIGILDHPIRRGDYQNILVSALAVMGISEDGGWVKVNDYTTDYSAVVKVSRMLVIYQSAVERKGAVAERAKEMGEEAAKDEVRSIFQ
ncbi:hypothetical protein CGRA01v4_00636 [Colletotrichum graminicola]|nr:hypothetical protein CGRA01v4_00636 [Colletotrichum graminicola]